MATKSSDARLDEIIEILPYLAGAADGERLREQLKDWIRDNGVEAQNFSGDAALGGWHLLPRSGDTQRKRHFMRAVLLWCRIYDYEAVRFNQLKLDLPAYSEERLKEKFREVAGLGALPNYEFDVLTGPSFSQLNLENCRWAMEAAHEGRKLIQKMMIVLPRVSMASGSERTKYEKWFGPFKDFEGRFREVERRLLNMNAHLLRRRIKLYYRGSRVSHVQIPDDLPGESGHATPLEPGEWARVMGQTHASRQPEYIHIQLGENFFDRGKTGKRSILGAKFARAGVIVHEITHDVFNSNDRHYGPTKSTAIRTLSDALSNADSYRLFCEEFLNGENG